MFKIFVSLCASKQYIIIRWILREYEKLKRSSAGLTFDSISSWISSRTGIFGQKHLVETRIKEHPIFLESHQITDAVFKATYLQFFMEQQKVNCEFY